MLLELLLDTHAWATTRPAHESEECADAMERDIMNVREMERDQGTSPAFTSTPPSARVPAHTSSPSPPPLVSGSRSLAGSSARP